MDRRLATILVADAVGSTSAMEQDEEAAAARFAACLAAVAERIDAHGGRVFNTAGDAVLAEFPSPVNALRAAIEGRAALAGIEGAGPKAMRFGLHLADVMAFGDDLRGDGVNLAARIEAAAEPGAIDVSRAFHEQVRRQTPHRFEDLGERVFAGISEPVAVLRLNEGGEADEPARDRTGHRAGGLAEGRAGGRAGARGLRVAAAAVALAALAGLAGWQGGLIGPAPDPADQTARAVLDGPSLAVLPIRDMSGSESGTHLANGITETLITELSRFGGLHVIARNSAFAYQGKAMPVEEIARELGVRYVLEGSMQRSDEAVRLTAQLVDSDTGENVWAERYDNEMGDIFALQDEVTGKIVNSIAAYTGSLGRAERSRLQRKADASLSAQELALLGLGLKNSFTPEGHAASWDFYSRAREIDPGLAEAYVGIAWLSLQKVWFGWSDDPEADLAAGKAAAERVVELAPEIAEGPWLLAEAHLLEGDFDRAEAEYEKALKRSPNHADLIALYGWSSIYLGEPARAKEAIERAELLNPHHPDWYDRAHMAAAFMAGDPEGAVAAASHVRQHVAPSLLYLAASHAELGETEAAKRALDEALALDPEASIEKYAAIETFRRPEDQARFDEGLRKAGLREAAPGG